MQTFIIRLMLAFIIVLYGATRFINNSLPVFLDEALYMRWVDTIAASFPNQILISLQEDGQPPLFFVLAALIKNLFNISDSLVLIRTLSIIFGGLALLFGMLLAWELSQKKSAPIIFGFLYCLSPFMSMYDRLGMRDSAMNFVFFSSLYYVVKWQKTRKNHWLWLAGVLVSAGILIKSIAWFVPLMLVAYLLLRKQRLPLRSLLSLCLPIALSVLIFVSTGTTGSVATKNLIFVTSSALAGQIRNNAYQSGLWLWQYLTPTVLIALLIALAINIYKNQHNLIALCLVVLLPIVIEIGIAQIFFPRYFLTSAAGLLLVLSLALAQLSSIKFRWLTYFLSIALLSQSALWSWQNVKDPQNVSLPQIETWQYQDGWPSGTGVKEVAQYLIDINPDIILTESSDLLRTGIPYYQPKLANKIHLLDNNEKIVPGQLVVTALHIKKTLPSGYNGTKIYEYLRSDNGDKLIVYKNETY